MMNRISNSIMFKLKTNTARSNVSRIDKASMGTRLKGYLYIEAIIPFMAKSLRNRTLFKLPIYTINR